MDYKSLNNMQRDKINQISKPDYFMEWEDPDIMEYLMGELPEIRMYKYDNEIKKEITSLKKVLSNYNAFISEKSDFLEEVEKKIADIKKIKESWHGLNVYEVETCVKLHRFCLISGEGGIGKSYFIKCLEEKLEQNNIAHLCIYGKFEKNINNIDIEEIIKVSDMGFLFIVDAINEMSEEGQYNLLNVLHRFKKYPRIRIVLSYRTNSMNSKILGKFQEISEYEYKFPGVSFESALNEVLKLSVPDVYMYEDILYSNNAFLLSRLCDVLSSQKLVDETENGIASITYILEQYIKKTIRKFFKGDMSYQGKDIWEDIKRIAKWMYRNDKKNIDENSLISLIKTGDIFISVMMQMGFISYYENNKEKYYYFNIDSLTDFLIGRSLFEDISGKDYYEQVNVIKSKMESLYNLKEAFIIAIFDNMSPDYKKIIELLEDTGLIDELDINTLVKVRFKHDDIKDFLEIFKPINHANLLHDMGGYTDKPFNCSNYLFEYYCESNERICNLSKVLAGDYFQNDIKQRLKNVLYFTTLNERTDRRDDEAFYFALLCCSAPNNDVRCLAMKLLYDLISKNENYVNKVMIEYDKIDDFYIQESIIYALSQLEESNIKIIEFYNNLIERQDNLTAKSIYRIATYLGKPYSYIMWNRKDLFKHNKNAKISDYLDNILFKVDIIDKDFLPFRYWGKDHIDMYTSFLINDKQDIANINNYLLERYSCVNGGNCNGSIIFEQKVMNEINELAETKEMDINSFMESFENVFKNVFHFYCFSNDNKSISYQDGDINKSIFMKCADIATGLYYGSLMCNYYINQFATYNNKQNNIGYEVYDPLEYGENIFITAPIPTYQDFVEKLGDYVINLLEIPKSRDINWVRNVELTRSNILRFLEPIEIKHQKWVMLAGRVSLSEKNKFELIWKDSYNLWCCSSENETIKDDGNARYLTIELEEYLGNLKSYSNNKYKPWLCKDVNNINSQSKIFDKTSLVLPPSDIIKFFNLKLNISDISWENNEKEKVIICNNNKNSYYINPIGGTVFIRKDYFDKFLENHTIKYFAFTERYITETGFADETSLHFEIINGNIVKEIKNKENRSVWKSEVNPLCFSCPHTHIVNFKKDGSSSLSIEIKKKY